MSGDQTSDSRTFGLLNDLYQLTMAYGYWKLGRDRWEATFHWTLRREPFGGGFVVVCGHQQLLALLDRFRFDQGDLDYLGSLRGDDGRPLFESGFLDELGRLEVTCDIDAAPEGSVCFAREPLLRLRGPLMLCQLLETALLNQLNFPTLIATKAARVCHLAAPGSAVLEFGLRRAQGLDGGLSASRAAYVGGCVATSNVLAGRRFGIPVKGTHAHSWVMSFEEEIESFRAFARAQPGNCILLVDTYDTLAGLERAVTVGEEMAERGEKLSGIRLDSGDLGELSVRAREMLDAGGLEGTAVVASSDLDELRIRDLLAQGARIDVWGVGTRLATGHPDGALTGVYKLGAVREASDRPWRSLLKVSDSVEKSSEPGVLSVRRFRGEDGKMLADVVYGLELEAPRARRGEVEICDPLSGERKTLAGCAAEEELLQPLLRGGRRVAAEETLVQLQQRVAEQLQQLPESCRALEAAESLPVGLEPQLAALKAELAEKMLRERAASAS